jgi:hypothetical protein
MMRTNLSVRVLFVLFAVCQGGGGGRLRCGGRLRWSTRRARLLVFVAISATLVVCRLLSFHTTGARKLLPKVVEHAREVFNGACARALGHIAQHILNVPAQLLELLLPLRAGAASHLFYGSRKTVP